MSIDWGSVPEAVAAVGTVGAFIAAGLLLRRESEISRRDVEERETRQAGMVAHWIRSDPFTPETEGEKSRERPVVVVRNGSSEPVYSVRVARSDDDIVAYVNQLGPGDEFTREWEWRQLADGRIPLPSLQFWDASGRWWQRTGTGELRQLNKGRSPKGEWTDSRPES